MRPYEQLTQRGQLGRLRALACGALRIGWSIEPRQLRVIAAHSFNTMFRVVTTDGERLALRVGGQVRIHPPETDAVESSWLSALANHSKFEAPVPIPTLSGQPAIEHTHPGTGGARTCSMFTWVPGQPLINNPTAPLTERAGEVLAELHEHATSMTAPSDATALSMTSAIYFGQQNMIATWDAPHAPPVREALARCDAELADLAEAYGAAPHLLHGDFGAHNVLAHYRRVRPIDFQDVRFGLDIHDLGIAIANLSGARADLVDPLRRGYARIRSWPEVSPQMWSMLAAARSLNIVNLALSAPASGIANELQTQIDLVSRWMESERRG